MSSFTVRRISQIDATLRVPGDKSMSHRAAMLAGIADGVSVVRNFLPSEDCVNTLRAMGALGVKYEVLAEMEGFGPCALRIHGTARGLKAASGQLDCGNSGTGMRLLAGLLAAQPFTTELIGDESLSGRPMGRIISPLEQMGAKIEALGEKPGCAPLRIHGGTVHNIRYEMPVASAQVKSAVLLAGLFCSGVTTVVQPAATRDHTERMLADFGVSVMVDGNEIALVGGQMPQACDFLVPGDISSAAFWLVAAAAIPGSRLVVKDVGLNPTRTAILAVLARMGAEVSITIESGHEGEPIGTVEIRGTVLKGTEILLEEVPNLIDEIPVIAVAGALATGTTVVRNAKELRVKETDRIATVVENLRRMGGEVEEFEDGLAVTGGRPLQGAEVDSYGDHRIAMAFAIAGLFADGETKVNNVACVNTSYPGFARQLEAIVAGRQDEASLALPIKSLE